MSGEARRRAFEVLEVASPGDTPSRIFDVFIMGLISANVLAVVLETVEDFSAPWMHIFRAFEVFSVVIFTIAIQIAKLTRVCRRDSQAYQQVTRCCPDRWPLVAWRVEGIGRDAMIPRCGVQGVATLACDFSMPEVRIVNVPTLRRVWMRSELF